MKQSGIWKAVMSIYNILNDFSCASGKDKKRTYTARGLFSMQHAGARIFENQKPFVQKPKPDISCKNETRQFVQKRNQTFRTKMKPDISCSLYYTTFYYNLVCCVHIPLVPYMQERSGAERSGAKRSDVPNGHASMLLLGEGSEATEPYNIHANLFTRFKFHTNWLKQH